MSKVSVIITVYNLVTVLDRCLESVCAQTFRDLQIVIVDDGSKDGSAEKCDVWAAKDSRVHVIHKENGGVSDARNEGIRKADGEYILFIDGDDYIEPWSVEKLFLAASEQNLDVLRANYKILYPNGHIRYKHSRSVLAGLVRTGEELFAQAYRENLYACSVCTGLYRRSYLLSNNLWFEKGIFHEDELWMPQVLVKARRANYLDVEFYCYIMRDGSITHLPDKRQHGYDLILIAKRLNSMNLVSAPYRTEWKNLVCGLYLYGVNTGQFIQRKEVDHLSKKFVLFNGLTRKNFLRTLLFVVNYRLYAAVSKIYESVIAKRRSIN